MNAAAEVGDAPDTGQRRIWMKPLEAETSVSVADANVRTETTNVPPSEANTLIFEDTNGPRQSVVPRSSSAHGQVPTDADNVASIEVKRGSAGMANSTVTRPARDVCTQKQKQGKACPWFVPVEYAHKWLSFMVLIESTNLISTLLYTLESYQRAAIVDLYETCGGFTLIPVMPDMCPSQSVLPNLRPCHYGLSELELCEADSEVPGTCQVSIDIDNCGNYDVYQKITQPKCEDVGCQFLTKTLWVVSFTSYFMTVTATSLHHTLRVWKDLEGRRCTHRSLVALLLVPFLLFIVGLVVGLTNMSPTTLIFMSILSPTFALTVWCVALILLHERSSQKISAALELPLYNAILASQLKPERADEVIGERKPFSAVLRVVEDLPEAALGCCDLYFFGGSWFAAFSLAMSVFLLLVQLIMGSFFTALRSAQQMAAEERPLEKE